MAAPLIFDQRPSLTGKPAVHALIVGVSAYPHLPKDDQPLQPHHFGMRQLSSAARTGYRIYRWLLERREWLPLPLGTIRLLLTPSDGEIQFEPSEEGLWDRASLDSFIDIAAEWRDDARSHPDNITLFYFAGHGVQRARGDQLILLEGFASGKGGTLVNAVETSNLLDGMAPSQEQKNIARTQLYFIDACRITPKEFLKHDWMGGTPIWSPLIEGEDDRVACVFYTTVPGQKAYAPEGDQTIFSRALISCLNGGAAVQSDEDSDVWHVTANSMNERLQFEIDQVAADTEVNQQFRSSGIGPRVVLHRLEGPPPVNIVVQVQPEQAKDYARIEVVNDEDETVLDLEPFYPHPYSDTLAAGYYRVRARIQPPTPPYVDRRSRTWQVRPPRAQLALKVIP